MRHDGILHGSLRADEGRDIVRVVRRADAPWAIGSRFFHCSHRCTLYHPNLANVGSRVLSWLGILCLQGSAESDAAIGAVRTNASWLRHLHLPANFLPSSRSRYTASGELMSTSSEGAPGSSGHTGLHSGLGRPVSGNNVASEPVLTRLEQVPQEQQIFNQIRKLAVRFLIIVFDPCVDDTPCYPSLRSRRSWTCMR